MSKQRMKRPSTSSSLLIFNRNSPTFQVRTRINGDFFWFYRHVFLAVGPEAKKNPLNEEETAEDVD